MPFFTSNACVVSCLIIHHDVAKIHLLGIVHTHEGNYTQAIHQMNSVLMEPNVLIACHSFIV